ncbi:MAG TPA: alpha/beta hydrolase [Anaerolineales bacterium]
MTPAPLRKGETAALDDGARSAASGAFVKLSQGTTHYERTGPLQSRPVVLVHGFSVPYFIWDPTYVALGQQGKHVIRYDLFGRGYSDRPALKYGIDLFVRQLLDLLNALEQAQADLVALSMGGPIAASFAVRHPERVRKLVLIDPSGVQPVALGGLYSLTALPGLSELIFAIGGTNYMLKKAAEDFFDPALVGTFRERYAVQMQFRGFQSAILSTVRNKMLGSFSAAYAALGKTKKPVLLIWGEKDSTVPFQHSQRLRELIPQAQFVPVPECGHLPHYERPEVVNPRILEFLA